MPVFCENENCKKREQYGFVDMSICQFCCKLFCISCDGFGDVTDRGNRCQRCLIKSAKTTTTVHSEVYRDYLVIVEFMPALTPDQDVFAVNAPAYYTPMVDGLKLSGVYAATVGDAIIAAKRDVDSMLLHPVTGRTMTKLERSGVTIEPTTIEDLG